MGTHMVYAKKRGQKYSGLSMVSGRRRGSTMRLKLLSILFMLSGCATRPVNFQHWSECEFMCAPGFVTEACVTFFKGEACRCEYDDREPEVLYLRE
jgi:hypothetical protein